MKKRLYFAYGSNCNLGQMARRCPAAKKVGPVTLDGYRLTFNGRRDGTGVANVLKNPGTVVHGLLWEITPACERSLNHYEGFPFLYGKEMVTVQTEDGESREAMVYVMTEKYRDPAMPCTDYFLGIVDGFTENGMNPHPVWEALEETEAECDREGLAV